MEKFLGTFWSFESLQRKMVLEESSAHFLCLLHTLPWLVKVHFEFLGLALFNSSAIRKGEKMGPFLNSKLDFSLLNILVPRISEGSRSLVN